MKELIINQSQVESITQQIKNNEQVIEQYTSEALESEKNAKIFNRCWHECQSNDLRDIMYNKVFKELNHATELYKKARILNNINFILYDLTFENTILESTYRVIKTELIFKNINKDEAEFIYNQVESTLSYAGIECGELLQELANALKVDLVA